MSAHSNHHPAWFAAACLLLPLLCPLSACSQATEDHFTEARENLVRRYISSSAGGREPVTRPAVLQAMRKVPRHKFIPESLGLRAYEDRPLPIGQGQTISQPYIVAKMTEALQPEADHVVLEVGTGSGYQAAVLAEIVKDVYSIEIVPKLGKRAARVLGALGYANAHTRIGDGYKGWPEHAPFDGIIVTAAPDHVPQPLVDQLKVGGRMVIPVGPRGRVQELRLLEKQKDGSVKTTMLSLVRFVPMTGEAEKNKR